ncbi:TonB-dependent receptor domain-containing protein [Nitrospira sp. BLG_2]|uniref:TonB-dependent receptor domain-containing protein n=1 Tax=Nitrospira sp. BLG_2 TaxID=3397507 RepID=UPI003B9B1B7E
MGQTKVSCLILVGLLLIGLGNLPKATAETSAELPPAAVTFDIPRQPLAQALEAFQNQSAIRFLVRADLIHDQQSTAIAGQYSPEIALRLLLAGTGLTYRVVGPDSVTIESALGAQVPAEETDPQNPTEEQQPLKIPLTEIIGTAPTALDHIPGSGKVITSQSIQNNHRFTINETLREVPGVHVRDEDGLGIRPNIGIRGLDPTRSRKVHIMEDGVPIMLMPYADPSSYYFPPIFRFDRIEVLKGSGQLLYGPQTIGGVINLITRMPPTTPEGHFQVWGGNLNYLNTHFDYGGTWGKGGYLVDYTHYQTDTPRFTNIRAKVDDLTLKTVQELSDRTQILAKFNYYRENSGIGYQGLTQADWAIRGEDRQTLFTNDHMDFMRLGYHVAVNHMFTANLTSTVNLFGHYIQRDWSRQSQQGVDINGNPVGGVQNGNNLPATAFSVVPANARFTNEREYWVWGVEPRFHYLHSLLGIKGEADFGARYMFEQSDRKQLLNTISGTGLPSSCVVSVPGATCLGENTFRTTNAYSFFAQERMFFGPFTVTPGFRVEHISYDQTNRLANNGQGTYGKTNFTEVLPGVGVTYSPFKNNTFFFGAHRGMAPPQISDAITGTGQVVDLGPELNWTYELGVRGNLAPWLGYSITGYQIDFSNQIISQSVAGGVGATLTSAGKTQHRGAEVAAQLDILDAVTGRNDDEDITLDINYTWVAQADFRGARNSSITGAALLPGEPAIFNTSGNRLPYSPEHLISAGIGYANRAFSLGPFNARVETQCISDQFGDDRNTVIPTPNGQRGIVRGWCMLNASVNQHVKKINTTFFFTGKNMLGQDVIMDRTRGIYPGLPALWQAGARWTF